MIDEAFFDLTVCPRDHQRLKLADDALLRQINQAIDEGRVKKLGGGLVEHRLDAALVREDGKLLYPVVADIPVLLADEAIDLDQLEPT